MIEHVLSKKPEISMEQLKSLVDSSMSKAHSRSALDAIHGVAEDLGVSLSVDLILAYADRKRQQAYERSVSQNIINRRKKRRQRVKLRSLG